MCEVWTFHVFSDLFLISIKFVHYNKLDFYSLPHSFCVSTALKNCNRTHAPNEMKYRKTVMVFHFSIFIVCWLGYARCYFALFVFLISKLDGKLWLCDANIDSIK